jgi:DNA-binding NarL/FixJ family response regulator
MPARIKHPAPTAGPSGDVREEAKPAPPCRHGDGPPIRLAIIDEDKSIHAELVEAMRSMAPTWRTESFFSAHDALDRLPGSPPDVALMDLCADGLGGVGCARSLIRIVPRLPVVMHTARGDAPLVLEALIAGVRGFLVKPQPVPDVFGAIERVARGGASFCSKAQLAVANAMRSLAASAHTGTLSAREMQVLACLSQNLYQKEIADRLGIGEGTVHSHVIRIYRKLGVHTAAQAVALVTGLNQRTPETPTELGTG